MHGIARLVVIAITLSATACIPITKTFLSEPGAQPNDKRIAGTWYWHKRDGSETVVIAIQRAEGKRLSIVWTKLNPSRATETNEAPARWMHFLGHTTRLGRARFVNLQFVRSDASRAGKVRFIVRYWLTKKGLAFAVMNEEMIEKAVRTGELTGHKERSSWVITSDRKTLIAFLRRHGAKAFNKPGQPLRRMRRTGNRG